VSTPLVTLNHRIDPYVYARATWVRRAILSLPSAVLIAIGFKFIVPYDWLVALVVCVAIVPLVFVATFSQTVWEARQPRMELALQSRRWEFTEEGAEMFTTSGIRYFMPWSAILYGRKSGSIVFLHILPRYMYMFDVRSLPTDSDREAVSELMRRSLEWKGKPFA
jgi:hypothetical protein